MYSGNVLLQEMLFLLFQFIILNKSQIVVQKIHIPEYYVGVFLSVLSVPSQPEDVEYVNSTEGTMTLSWKQPGVVDKYIVEVNNTETVNFTVVSSNSVNVSLTVGESSNSVSVLLTVRDLLTSGAYYCISVTAVSGHLHSVGAMLCNYTGDNICCKPFFLSSHCLSIGVPFNRDTVGCFLQCPFVMIHVQWAWGSTSCQQPMSFCLFHSCFC